MSSKASAKKATRRRFVKPPAFGAQLWEFSSSLRLLLMILIIAAIPLVVGTFLIQKPLGGFDPAKEIERIGPHLYALFESMSFYNIYHSWYFRGILLMISYNNVCCTIDRFFVKTHRLTSKAVGVIIVHVGVNVVLAGAFYGSQAGVEGFMQVFEDAPEPTDWMFNVTTGDRIPLPFATQLDDFRLVMWDKPDERIFLLDPQTRETQHRVVLDRGRPFPQTHPLGPADYAHQLWWALTGGPKDALRIEAYFPDATMRAVATETGAPDDPWVLELRSSTHAESGEGYLTADSPNRITFVPGQLSAGYTRARTPEQFARALQSDEEAGGDAPTLIVRDIRTGAATRFPARVGETVTLPDGAVSIRILEHIPDFARAPEGGVTSRSDAPNNPALHVELRDGDVVRTGWLLARFAAASVVRSDRYALSFRQGPRAGETAHTVDFVAGPNGERKLVHRLRGAVVDVMDAEPDTIFVLEELGTQMQVVRFLDGATFAFEVVNQSDHPHRPAIQVTLIQDGVSQGTEWLFVGQPLDMADGSTRVVYDRDFAIREFQSDLSIFKNGRKIIDRHEIIVNRYLAVDGYHIYQASYDEKGGRWSGLSIKRDPGIPVIYTGFGFMFLGVFFLFYMRPTLEARRTGRPLFPEAGVDDQF